jgi:hypothetical protein
VRRNFSFSSSILHLIKGEYPKGEGVSALTGDLDRFKDWSSNKLKSD